MIAPPSPRLSMRRRIIVFLSLFVLGALITTFFIYCESAARIIIALRKDNTLKDAQQLWAETIADAPYFTIPFVKEKNEVIAVFGDAADGFEIIGDFHGHYINVIDHKRRTEFQPARADHTIYFIGDSTLFSSNVPDEYTIASALQWRLNHAAGLSYKVVNLGVPTLTTSRALTVLKGISLQPGDQVLFYSAVSDAEAIFQEAARHRREDIQFQLCDWLQKNRSDVALGTLYCQWIDEKFPPEIDDSAYWQRELTRAIAKYKDSVLAAQAYTEAAGASFYAFLPPQLWTHPLSNFEQRLVKNTKLVFYGKGPAFNRFWSVLESAHQQLVHQGIKAFNLSHVLDYARAHRQEKFYYDCCHLNAAGNALVAAHIFDLISSF